MANTAAEKKTASEKVLGKLWKVPSLDAATSLPSGTDTEIVPVFQDGGKKPIAPAGPYSAIVQKLRKSETFAAGHGSTCFVRFAGKRGAQNVLFVGMGSAEQLTEERARQAAGSAWSKINAEKAGSAAVAADALGGKKSSTEISRAFAEGLVLGAYHWHKHKKDGATGKPKYKGPSKIAFVTKDKAVKTDLGRALSEARAAAEAANVARDWSNEPSNIGTPESYADHAKALAKEYGLGFRVIDEAEAKKERMNLFLAVGQGSEREGKVVILEYKPKKVDASTKTIAFVGKGVTFDSGGISIKPSMRMEDMKHDMTGAATVMGAMTLVAKWQVPHRVIGILALTENMPDGAAVQPGNVIEARNGKTVEIINTDAEGRLILADVLDYAQDLKPDAIVDIATLTGAVLIALGKQCCAVLGNDQALIDEVRKAGAACGERSWQLPLFDEYFDDLKSDTADMKNSANDSLGGTIRGAAFLKQFIRKGTRWAHLDIAATAYNMGHLPYFPKKGASGAQVRTLAQFARDFQG